MNILYLAPTPFFSVRGAPLVTHDTIALRITRCGRWLPFRNVSFGASVSKAVLDGAIFLHLLWRLLIARFGFGKRYDCIFALDESAFACWTLTRILNCPVIYDMDASIVEQFEASPRFRWLAKLGRFAELQCIRVAKVVIPQCQAYADRVSAIDPRKELVVVPDLPLVTAEEVDSAPIASVVSELQLEHPVFLYVGNLGTHQGVDLLIAACDLLQRQGGGGSLVIAGGRPKEIRRMAARHPAARFLGIVDPEDLPGLYRVADVVVAPRRSGSNTPMKIYDYMHSGCAIVATNLAAHTQVLDEGCAILVDPTIEDLATGMRQAATDPRYATDLANIARDRVAQLTSREAFQEGLDKALAIATSHETTNCGWTPPPS